MENHPMPTTPKSERASKRTGKTGHTHQVSANGNDARAADASPPTTAAPKQPTKAAQVEALLTRSAGASLDELCHATGWLPHTCRAFLTGLRKKGRAIERSKREDGTTIYRLSSNSVTGTSAVPEAAEAVS
jgi:hypothetical protein